MYVGGRQFITPSAGPMAKRPSITFAKRLETKARKFKFIKHTRPLCPWLHEAWKLDKMASAFQRGIPRIRTRKTHVVAFQDHAGNPALTVFRGEQDNPLPRLYSYSIYFTHPEADPGDTDSARKLYETITQGPRYNTNSVVFRLDLYFIPNGTQDDCIRHYRAEKNARGDFKVQIDAVVRDSTGKISGVSKMPGLVSSYIYDKIAHRYHSLIYVSSEANWQTGDQTMVRVEFDPLSKGEYEKYSKDPGDPREPSELPETHIEVEALNDSSPGFGRETGPGRSVGSMGYEMWDRAPREHMGEEAWEEARDKGWNSW